MLSIEDKKSCTGCYACYSICPVKAITMVQDNEGFEYPEINKSKCIKCGMCKMTCPSKEKVQNNNNNFPEVFASWSFDYNNKMNSSSGGVFYELAKHVISMGGIIVGAGFDKNFTVLHKAIDNLEDLNELRGSKYVQSQIGDTYLIIKQYLQKGKYVLFVGTPCQVAGLYSFLNNKMIDKLYTIDIICHGTPSPKVYKKYISELKDRYNSKINNVKFRDKKNGWKNFSIKVEFENKKVYRKNKKQDPFLIGFLNNLYLRPSCHTCKYSAIPRLGDITLGDFWEIRKQNKNLDDDKGTSEILINSMKGKKLLNEIKSNIHLENVDLEFGIKANPCLVSPVAANKYREDFFEQLEKKQFNKLINEYFPRKSLIQRIVIKMKFIASKYKK